MDQIRTLIIDDEPLARAGMRLRLQRHDDVEIVAECEDGYAAVETIQDVGPDLLFLDVQMPGLDGFGVLEALEGHKLPAVVFVTAYDDYAMRAFRVHAVDYILKPADDSAISEALSRVRGRLAQSGSAAQPGLAALIENYHAKHELQAPAGYLQRILVRGNQRVYFVKTGDVTRVESADNYLKVFTDRGQHVIRGTMRELEQRLDPATFLRVHRQVIVNLDQIKEIQIASPGEYMVVLKDGTSHRVGRFYRDRLLNRGF